VSCAREARRVSATANWRQVDSAASMQFACGAHRSARRRRVARALAAHRGRGASLPQQAGSARCKSDAAPEFSGTRNSAPELTFASPSGRASGALSALHERGAAARRARAALRRAGRPLCCHEHRTKAVRQDLCAPAARLARAPPAPRALTAPLPRR
jgi:hypothetical protein